MIDSILIPNPLRPERVERTQQQKQTNGNVSESPFARLLDQKNPTQEVKFSQHAQERLRARNISFTASDIANLEGAVSNVALKGGKESLVMIGDAALVVSVKNRTVVTAMDRFQMKGNIFTNIDSAVVI